MNKESREALRIKLEKKVKRAYDFYKRKFYLKDSDKKRLFVEAVNNMISNAKSKEEQKALNRILKKYLKEIAVLEKLKKQQKLESKVEDYFGKVSELENYTLLKKTIFFKKYISNMLSKSKNSFERKTIRKAARKYSFLNPLKINTLEEKNHAVTEQDNTTSAVLEEARKKKTAEIKQVCFCTEKEWNALYKMAKCYKKTYGNLNMPLNFKTFDGITYDREGVSLGYWIQFQPRVLIYQNRVDKLQELGVLDNVRADLDILKTICFEIGISYERYEDILSHLSVIELMVKLSFLIDNELPIIFEGNLHEIFTMSSLNMKCKYGLSFEEMSQIYNRDFCKLKREK